MSKLDDMIEDVRRGVNRKLRSTDDIPASYGYAILALNNLAAAIASLKQKPEEDEHEE